MSFADCVLKKVADGLITEKQAKTAINEYDALYQKYTQAGTGVDAAALAAAKFSEIKLEQVRVRKENAERKILAITQGEDLIKQRFNKYTEEYAALNKTQKAIVRKPDYERAINDFLEDTYTRQKAVEKEAMAMMGETVGTYRDKIGAVAVNKLRGAESPDFKNAWRAAGGDLSITGDAAKHGKQIRKAIDYLAEMYKAHGGIMGNLENWLPQIHRWERIAAVDFNRWVNDIIDLLDYDKIINPANGMPFQKGSPDFMKAMKEIYDDLSTNGAHSLRKKLDGNDIGDGGISEAQKYMDHRFLRFKDVDAQLKYNDMYGVGNKGLFDALMHHVNSLSRDIGIMQKMGPDSEEFMKHMSLAYKIETGAPLKKNGMTQKMYNVLSGKTMSDGHDTNAYKFFIATKNTLMMSQLGSAVLSSTTDVVNSAMAAKMKGLKPINVIKGYFGGLDKGSKEYMQQLKNIDHISDIAQGEIFGRFTDEGGNVFAGVTALDRAVDVTRKGADMIMKASLLTNFTQFTKNNMTRELHGNIASHAGYEFNNLPPLFLNAAKEIGVTEDLWNKMRKADPLVFGEAKFITPSQVALVDTEAALKLSEWTEAMRGLSVNEPTLRTRAIATGGHAPGFDRFIQSSLWMYKSYPLTMTYNYLLPSLERAVKSGDGAAALGLFLVGSTTAGAAAIWAKDLTKGRTPRDVDAKFWMAAQLQGGGAGILGDFIFGDYTRAGTDPVSAAMGPVFGLAVQTGQTLSGARGPFAELYMSEQKKAMDEGLGDFVNRAGGQVLRSTPATSLWYGRLFYERTVIDAFNELTDENAHYRAQKMERRLEKTYGVGRWSKPYQEIEPEEALPTMFR